MKTAKQLYEAALSFAYYRFPWRVTVASESYMSGYKAAAKDIKSLVKNLCDTLETLDGEQVRELKSFQEVKEFLEKEVAE